MPARKLAAMRELNPDVSVTLADQSKGRVDLALMVIGSEAARRIADEIAHDRDVQALVIARLDAPERIFVIPNAQNSQSLDAQFGIRSEAADFIAMLATAEAFKQLAGYAENPTSAIIEFDGYETRVRVHP